MFDELLSSASDGEKLPYDLLVEKTEGYSGSDIRLLCKEAAMQPLRRLMVLLEEKQEAVPEDGTPLFKPLHFNCAFCLVCEYQKQWKTCA